MLDLLSPDEQEGEGLEPTGDLPSKRVWIWAPGEQGIYWDELYEAGLVAIGCDELGDLQNFNSIDQFKAALTRSRGTGSSYVNIAKACFDFTYSMSPGDIVYAKRGTKTILGRGIIEGDYRHDPNRTRYRNVRQVRWTDRGEWASELVLPVKALTEWTRYPEAETLSRLFNEAPLEGGAVLPSGEREPYGTAKAVQGLFLEPIAFEGMLDVWRVKRNLVLQGAPGVGKSFLARRLAYALMGYKDGVRARTVQFHQSYSYEDFVQGFRPHRGGGFQLHDGVFVESVEGPQRIVAKNTFLAD